MKKKWIALDRNGWDIVSVVAENEADARERVRETLMRDGRWVYYGAWREGGERVEEYGEVKES